MATLAGDILALRCTSQNLGNVIFDVKGSESNTIDKGGFRTASDQAGITGSGRAIYKMNNNRWMAEIKCANEQSTSAFAVAQNLCQEIEAQDWTIQHISGVIYGGKGKIVGDLNLDLNEGTFTLKIEGDGFLNEL